MIGGLVVMSLVGYLTVTGMGDGVYFHTPAELVPMVTADPGYRENAVRVGGRVVPGAVTFDQRILDLRFEQVDIEDTTRFPVTYQGPLPGAFKEGADVVVTGLYTAEGVYEVLTTCGSRYEAAEEDYFS